MPVTSLRHLALAISIAAAAPLLLAPATAAAQSRPDQAAERQRIARMKAEQGLKLFGADRWPEAYDWLREADLLFHAPTLSLYMARCLRKMGKLIEARALYEKLIAEPLPEAAPAAFVEAVDAAKVEALALKSLIPTVLITVSGVPRGTATLTLDGKPLSEEEKELDPGSYTIEASAGDGERERAIKSFTLQEGTHQRIELALRVQPTSPQQPVEDAKKAASTGGSLVPAGIAFGLGAVGLGIGAATGTMSLGKVADIESRCHDGVCAAGDKAGADSARTLGHVSTASFIAGGVFAAAGVVLVVVRPRSGQPATATSAASWNATLGMGRFDLQGSF